MKKAILHFVLVVASATLFGLAGCEKAAEDVTQTAESGQDFSTDMSALSTLSDLVEDIAGTQGFMMKTGKTIIPITATVTYTDTLYTDGDGVEMMVDFGPYPGVECGDGVKRFGKLTVSATKPFSQVGSVVTAYTGKSGLGINKKGELVMFVSLKGQQDEDFTFTRTAPDKIDIYYYIAFTYRVVDTLNPTSQVNGYYPMTGNFTVTQISGKDQPGVLGDEYTITGNSSGKNRSQKPYVTKITEALYRKVDGTCSKTFTKGKIELQNQGAKSYLNLDFGSGECDNIVIIKVPGGITKTYELE